MQTVPYSFQNARNPLFPVELRPDVTDVGGERAAVLQFFLFPVPGQPALQLRVAGEVIYQVARVEIGAAFDEGGTGKQEEQLLVRTHAFNLDAIEGETFQRPGQGIRIVHQVSSASFGTKYDRFATASKGGAWRTVQRKGTSPRYSKSSAKIRSLSGSSVMPSNHPLTVQSLLISLSTTTRNTVIELLPVNSVSGTSI